MKTDKRKIEAGKIKPKPLEVDKKSKIKVPKELKPVEVYKRPNKAALKLKDWLRVVERFFNKYLNFIVGNEPNPIPVFLFSGYSFGLIFLIVVVILFIMLWIR